MWKSYGLKSKKKTRLEMALELACDFTYYVTYFVFLVGLIRFVEKNHVMFCTFGATIHQHHTL